MFMRAQVSLEYEIAKATYDRESEAFNSIEANLIMLRNERKQRSKKFKELRSTYSDVSQE